MFEFLIYIGGKHGGDNCETIHSRSCLVLASDQNKYIFIGSASWSVKWIGKFCSKEVALDSHVR